MVDFPWRTVSFPECTTSLRVNPQSSPARASTPVPPTLFSPPRGMVNAQKGIISGYGSGPKGAGKGGTSATSTRVYRGIFAVGMVGRLVVFFFLTFI